MKKITVLLLCLLSQRLLAQETAEPLSHAELLKEVMDTFKSGNVSDAILRLETEIRAHEVKRRAPAPEILALLGVLYLEANQPENAYRLLQPLTERIADPGVLYHAGRAAFALHKQEQGEAFFARSAELSPISPAARSLGLLRGQRGDFVEGYKLLRPWALQYPDDLTARLLAAYLALELERPSEAEQLLSELPQDQPRVRLLWGWLLLQKDDPGGAIAIATPLEDAADRAIPPELELDLRRILAEAYLRTDRPAEALARLRQVDPNDRAHALLLAKIHLARGDATTAVSTIRPFAEPLVALTTWPVDNRGQSMKIVQEYARALIAAGDLPEAAAILEKALQRDRANVEGWELLQHVLKATKQTKKAKAVSEIVARFRASEGAAKDRFLKVGSDDTTGKKLQEAQKWLFRGDSERALVLIRQEAALSPADLRPRFLEFQTLLMMKRFAEAEEVADRTLELAPRNADAVYQKGILLMARDSLDEAEKMFRRALELAPDHTATMNDLATLLLARGRTNEAREVLERLLILQPDDQRAKAKLEKLKRR